MHGSSDPQLLDRVCEAGLLQFRSRKCWLSLESRAKFQNEKLGKKEDDALRFRVLADAGSQKQERGCGSSSTC